MNFTIEHDNIYLCSTAILFGIYLMYESLEAAIEDNRGRGVIRGLRYVITASFGLWLVWNGLVGSADISDVLGGAAISIRFLANVEKRWKTYRGQTGISSPL